MENLGSGSRCAEVIDTYLEVRRRGATSVEKALRALGMRGPLAVSQFDTVADAVHLYNLELEDAELADYLDVGVVEQLVSIREHRTLAATPG